MSKASGHARMSGLGSVGKSGLVVAVVFAAISAPSARAVITTDSDAAAQTAAGAFPAVGYLTRNGTTPAGKLGGSAVLIAPNEILTAAHNLADLSNANL